MACKYPALFLLLRQIFLNFLVDVRCGSLPNPSFGRVDLTGTTVGSTATYSCQSGYQLVGESTRTCQSNGQWSGVAPICTRMSTGSESIIQSYYCICIGMEN